MTRITIIALALVACASETHEEIASLACPPVQASQPIAEGDVLTDGLRTLTVDNGIVRVRYGAHALDHRDEGVTLENPERHMDHVLAARHTDHPSVAEQGCLGSCHNGTHWHDAQYPWYGDGVSFSTALVDRDADRVRVLRADDDAVELVYEWDALALNATHPTGPASRDHNGNPNYTSGGVLKYVPSVRLWKSIRIERCTPAYYVALRSDPPLIWPDQGPRAVRVGYASTRAAWACDGSATALHPSAGAHVSLGTVACIADVPRQEPGMHGDWPFVRVLRTATPRPMTSLQYSATQLGSPGVLTLDEIIGEDGRPRPWQACIGAVEYVTSDADSEPTTDAMQAARTVVCPLLE